MANHDPSVDPPPTRRWWHAFSLKRQGRMKPTSRLPILLVMAAAILQIVGSTYLITRVIRSTTVEAQAQTLIRRLEESRSEALRLRAMTAWAHSRLAQESRAQPSSFDWYFDWSKEAPNLLSSLEEAGLRCLAVFHKRGPGERTDRLLASAGSCPDSWTLQAQLRETPEYEVVDLGDRARMVYQRGSSQALLIEFVPRVTSQLQLLSGQRNAIIGAAILLVLAVLLYVRVKPPESRRSRDRQQAMYKEMSATLSQALHNLLTSMKERAQLLAEGLPSESPERHQANLLVGEAERLDRLTAAVSWRDTPGEHRG